MSSPAEKFAQAARRRKFDSSHLGHFVETLPYPLDDFQSEAARTVQDGRSVLVAAPTGAGKSVVGEFACYLAVHTRAQGVLHDADQGAVEPEVRRPRRDARNGERRAVDR